MTLKQFLKKEVYTLRLTKKNRIVAFISGNFFLFLIILGPFAGFILGIGYVSTDNVDTVDWFLILLLLVIAIPILVMVALEKAVFKTLIETEADRAEDIEVAVIVDEMKKSFSDYLDHFPYQFVIFKGEKK